MKNILPAILLLVSINSFAQSARPTESQRKQLTNLIAQYAEARENRDTILLKKILTEDVDQLVSTGEWRSGIRAAVEGMLRSSANSPGTRTLTVDKMRLTSPSTAIVDCKYQIQNNASSRNMWSSFIVVMNKGSWKISAIRNMLPAAE